MDLPSQEYLAQCVSYDPETGVLTWKERPLEHFCSDAYRRMFNTRCAGKPAFASKDGMGYLNGTLNRQSGVKAHRVIWKLVYGFDPFHIDHINGDKTDNRIANLRDVDQAENAKNKCLLSNNKTGVMGVRRANGYNRWLASIKVGGQTIPLGSFHTIDEAIVARKSAERRFGFHPNHGREAA